MENLKQAATLLYAVLNDLDEVPVAGLENQRKFLNCTDGIKTAAHVILQHVNTLEAENPGHVARVNGIDSSMENINTEVRDDGR